MSNALNCNLFLKPPTRSDQNKYIQTKPSDSNRTQTAEDLTLRPGTTRTEDRSSEQKLAILAQESIVSTMDQNYG